MAMEVPASYGNNVLSQLKDNHDKIRAIERLVARLEANLFGEHGKDIVDTVDRKEPQGLMPKVLLVTEVFDKELQNIVLMLENTVKQTDHDGSYPEQCTNNF
jgi:hypothetical protein